MSGPFDLPTAIAKPTSATTTTAAAREMSAGRDRVEAGATRGGSCRVADTSAITLSFRSGGRGAGAVAGSRAAVSRNSATSSRHDGQSG